MRVTEVKIRKRFSEGAMRAIVSVTIDNCLAIHDIKLVNVEGRDILVMPARRTSDGRYKDIVHPICSESRGELEQAVKAELLKECENS